MSMISLSFHRLGHRCSLNRAYTTQALPLNGRSAIITGGSRGIGLAIAKVFVQNGASCLLVGRNIDALRTAAQDEELLGNSNSSDVAWLSADITQRNIWRQLFDPQKVDDQRIGKEDGEGIAWAARHPHPHILVNAAGIMHTSLFLRTSPEQQQAVMDTNLTGTINACREVGKRMVKRRGVKQQTGCIINIASLLATHGGRGSSIYATSKAGILGLTRVLAAEMAPMGVRANAVAPGYIDTDMTSGFSDDSKASLSKRIPLGRFGNVREVADAALFLATNQYANGCILNLDGGLGSEL